MEEFAKGIEKTVESRIAEFNSRTIVAAKNKKRTAEEAGEVVMDEGMLSQEEMMKLIQSSKFWTEDEGIVIPELHPYFNLPVALQMKILDLHADDLDECMDFIENNAPTLLNEYTT